MPDPCMQGCTLCLRMEVTVHAGTVYSYLNTRAQFTVLILCLCGLSVWWEQ
jgi:hypothetical protein